MPLSLMHATTVATRARRRGPSLLERLAAALLREIRVRRDLRTLSGLGETALHDIGLTRGGLEDAVRHGRSEMPGLDIVRPIPTDIPAGFAKWP